jgi:flagellar hook-associated protein 1 FlgK
MGLGATLSNALSGMSTSQSSLEVLSRNVANAGTPGYHKQSLAVVDAKGANSTHARTGEIQRAFTKSLQVSYANALSASGFAGVSSDMLNRLQAYLGKPGDAGSLDTMFSSLQGSLQSLSTSPDDYATRADVVLKAQQMVATLNSLTTGVQGLRQETETQIAGYAEGLNQNLATLAQINTKIADPSTDGVTRSLLADQRDRLVGDIASVIDVRVDYRSDGSVALMTRTGVGLLDGKPSSVSFQSAGALTADKQFSVNSSQSGVGKLIVTTPSGLQIDLVQQNVIQSGKLGALITLRDQTLVDAQGQLDQIAAGLAQAFSTNTVAGAPASSGAQSGYSVDLSPVRDGNDVTLSYSSGGVSKTVRLVRVDDTSKLPLDYVDANGTRVVGADFSAGAAAVASKLSGILGSGFSVSGSGATLTVLDDGTTNNTDVGSLVTHSTATATQDGTLGLNLFVDRGGGDFTDSLSGRGQKVGFAGRISVNPAILSDNTLLVKSLPTGTLGNADRANYLLEQLQSMSFASSQTGNLEPGSFRLGGTISDMISQTLNRAGSLAEVATGTAATQDQTVEAINQRMDSEYGVNVDEEMARLLELQNAYAANSRVIATVQELMKRLMDL